MRKAKKNWGWINGLVIKVLIKIIEEKWGVSANETRNHWIKFNKIGG